MTDRTQRIERIISFIWGAMGDELDRAGIEKFFVAINLDYALDSELDDLLGYIEWASARGENQPFIVMNLMHDIGGFGGVFGARNPGFTPRTAGYRGLVSKQ